jgi:hypothetical protein
VHISILKTEEKKLWSVSVRVCECEIRQENKKLYFLETTIVDDGEIEINV